MSAGLVARMKDVLSWEATTGYTDEYATDKSYASPITLRAQLSYAPESLRTDSGQEILAERTAFIATGDAIEIGTEDRITWPDGSQPLILQANRWPDVQGRTFVTKVFFRTRV